jgi:hypothetical protein
VSGFAAIQKPWKLQPRDSQTGLCNFLVFCMGKPEDFDWPLGQEEGWLANLLLEVGAAG